MKYEHKNVSKVEHTFDHIQHFWAFDGWLLKICQVRNSLDMASERGKSTNWKRKLKWKIGFLNFS